MRKTRIAFVSVFAVSLLGMFPSAACAQDPTTPATSTSLDKLIHSPEDRLGQMMRWDIKLTYGLDQFSGLQGVNGQERYYDRSVFGAAANLDFLLNQEGVKGNSHDNEFRVGVMGDYESTSDNDGFVRRSYRGIGLLDYYRTGGMAYVYLGSTQVNGNLTYNVRIASGADYLNWGRFYGVMWRSQVAGELGWLGLRPTDGLALGPIAGVQGDLRVGEHQSNLMDLEMSGGVRFVSESITFDVRFLARCGMDDANKLTGGPGSQKVQREYVHLGVGARLLLWGRAAVSFSWTAPMLDRSEVYDGPAVFSDQVLESKSGSLRFGFEVLF